jgi:hypothetical protein
MWVGIQANLVAAAIVYGSLAIPLWFLRSAARPAVRATGHESALAVAER